MLSLIALSALLLSVLVPPFQSPDELDHVKRAYLLSRGQLLLETSPGEGSGGMVDTGLLTYMSVFWHLPFKPEQKMTAAGMLQSRSLQWTRQQTFSPAPGTGYYLPLAYLPQAAALAVGRHIGLSVDASYRAARLLSLLTALALVAWALRLHPLPPVVIGLLALPMTLFQLTSASLDGVSYALALLSLACYLHASQARGATRPWVLATFTVAVFIVITCRFHLFPMVLLFAALWQMTGRRTMLWAGVTICLLALAWTVLAMQSTVDPRVATGTPARTVLLHYLADPGALLTLVVDTLNAPNYLATYVQSFIGILGWLDASFGAGQYTALGWGVVLLALASVGPAWRWRGREIGWRLLLLVCSIACVVLIFVALLVTWTPHPARVIEGVQGRYFWVPVLMACLALAPSTEVTGRLRRAALISVQLGFILLSTYSTASLLLTRYWAA